MKCYPSIIKQHRKFYIKYKAKNYFYRMDRNNTLDTILYGDRGYPILSQWIKDQDFSKIFLLVDSNTLEHCAARFQAKLSGISIEEVIEMPAGEIHKHLGTCQSIWETISDYGGDRKSLIINLGGGVVTDLGGFVAATFKRGISFVNIPTSLLAMVDASVGGKTGVDFQGLKNQIGVIVPPAWVLIDPEFLNTLPSEEYRSGYAEMLKHGLIADAFYWKKLSDYAQINTEDMQPLIQHSVGIKASVVEKDPNENGLRKILNYGHTLGHAIESYFLESEADKTLLHGEAIAIGMITEAFLSHKLCGLSAETMEQIKLVFKQIYPRVDILPEAQSKIVDLLKFDKKNSHGRIKFALLEAIGKPMLDVEVPEELLQQAFDFYRA
ncbi:MAG: 3-dehydroquinate synthase [Flavobacteriaceae bacterium]